MRDPARERALPKAAQDLIQRYYEAYTSSGRAGRIRWENVYAALEEGDPLAIPEIEENILSLKEYAKKRAGWDEEEREEKLYNSQAVELDPSWSPTKIDRRLERDTPVWMYHGTSTKLCSKIMRDGLRPDARRTWPDATPGYVYLTVEPGSWSKPAGDARFYAERAAGRWGGDPVVLRLIVPWGWLESDEDDADLQSGRLQYRTSETIPPSAIMEFNGERIDHGATCAPRRRKRA
jgi:hypothetical protein